MAASLGKMADDVGTFASPPRVHPFERIGRGDLCPVFPRERHVGQDIIAGSVHSVR